MELLQFFFLATTSLFVIIDPLGNVPIFLSITQGSAAEEQKRMARIGALTAGGILIFFTFTGQWLFRLLGISFPAFEIAGGIILLVASLDMLRARGVAIKTTPHEQSAASDKVDIAVSPLATPMLAGPGAISTAIVLSTKAASQWEMAALAAAICLNILIAYICLNSAAWISTWMGPIGSRVVARLVGVLLLALAVQFILNGYRGAF